MWPRSAAGASQSQLGGIPPFSPRVLVCERAVSYLRALDHDGGLETSLLTCLGDRDSDYTWAWGSVPFRLGGIERQTRLTDVVSYRL